MEESEKQKLIKLLNLSQSEFDGEALNAIRAANKILKKYELTFDQIIVISVAKRPQESTQQRQPGNWHWYPPQNYTSDNFMDGLRREAAKREAEERERQNMENFFHQAKKRREADEEKIRRQEEAFQQVINDLWKNLGHK